MYALRRCNLSSSKRAPLLFSPFRGEEWRKVARGRNQ